MNEISPYRGEMISRAAGAEIARLNEENTRLYRALARRGLVLEASTAGAFAVAGLALISTGCGDVFALSVAWTSFIGGIWGALKLIGKSGSSS